MRAGWRCASFASVAWLAGCAFAAQVAAPPGAWILWQDHAAADDENNQQSYRAVLDALRYRTAIRKISKFVHAPADPGIVLVVPRGAGERLCDPQRRELLRYLTAGGAVVADGRQAWLEQLGFHWEAGRFAVSNVTDLLYPSMTLRWQAGDPVDRFTPPSGARRLMTDKDSGQVLATAGSYGAGRYLHLAAPLDPHTRDGTSHYPYFARYLAEAFGTSPSLGTPRLEAYFDPSYRVGADLDALTAAWRRAGIRNVYAAAWQSRFPYSDFVRACHRSGLGVYAWFVLPAATQKMWDEHPEWRERTAAGTDQRVGWRYSLNLENPACFRAAMDWMKGVLSAQNWDGLNLSELNYDADFENYLRADRFVPMNEDVRRDFERRAGFDPALLFNAGSPYFYERNQGALKKFLRYREEIVLAWHRRVLDEIGPLRRGKQFEVIVTLLDSLHGDYVRPALGVDSRRIVRLASQFDCTVQVEDPAHFWAQPPNRYRRFARDYRKLVRDPRRLIFDINVVADRDIARTTLPSAIATGTELALTVAAATSQAGRVALYSEFTVPSQDWQLLR